MQPQRQLSLRQLVLLSGSVPVILLAILLVTVWHGLQGSARALGHEHTSVQPALAAMADARLQVIQIQQWLTDVSATGDASGFATADDHLAKARASLQRIAALVPELRDDASATRELLDRFHETGVRMANAYLTAGRAGGNAIMQAPQTGFDDRAAALTARLQAMSDKTQTISGASTAATEASLHTATWSSLGLGIVIALLFLGTSLFLQRRLLGLLGGEPALAVAMAQRIAQGDLSVQLETHPGDTSSLVHALARMQTDLRARLETDQARNQTMQRITSALDKASTNMMVTDARGQITHLNQACEAMLRQAAADIRQARPALDPARIIGSRFADFHPDPAEQQAQLAALQGTYVTQLTLGSRTFRLTINPIVDQQGERLGSVVEWVDRTSEMAAEAELDALLEAVTRGDFSQRLSTEDKTGFFRDIAEGMNNLADIVSHALDDLASVLQSIARADLTRTIESRYKGRFGELKQDTNATVRQLERLVVQIRDATDAIYTAASEIAAGNADLSQRTEEQASSLEETASAMEQFNATVRQNAQHASQAQELAHQADDQARAGGELVQRVVSTMADIQGASQRIADIISVIDGIAFQTNILALNASIEAAHAGEQGKGFAVVAAEVRNLAQRSALAAKEIKTLIEDSVGKVDSGAALVRQTGATMTTIVGSFEQVVGLVTEIAAASREQSEGIGQVAKAVGQMDEVTQRNAALVEEAAAAAQSLEDQATSLRRAVGVFRLDAKAAERDAHTPDAAAEIDFDDFVQAHQQWSKRLRRVVEGRSEPQNPDIVSCDDKCALGQWIHGPGSQFASIPSYPTLRTKHAEFHQCAGDVLRRVIVGERDAADRILTDRFARLSGETIEQIRRLEQQCRHHTGHAHPTR